MVVANPEGVRGLPTSEDLTRLATLYLAEQRRHWPSLAGSDWLSADVDPVVMAKLFRERQESGSLAPVPAAAQVVGGRLAKLAVGYLRYSDDNSNPTSLDDQLRQILQLAQRDDRFIPWNYLFADKAMTGRNPRRGGYQLLKLIIADASHPFSNAYIDDFSRGGRDLLEWMKLSSLMSKSDKGLIVSVGDGVIDGTSTEGQFKLMCLGMQCQMFSAQLQQKVRRGMQGAALRHRNTGKVPFGYKLVPALSAQGHPVLGGDGRPLNELAVNPIERDIFNRAREDYVNGMSMPKLVGRFNAEQVQRRTNWTCKAVLMVLTRPICIGVQVYNRTRTVMDKETGKTTFKPNPRKEWIRWTSPALRMCSTRDYLKVLRTIRARSSKRKPSQKAPSRNESYPTTLLSGDLFCGYCGRELSLFRSALEGKYRQLCCVARNGRQDNCQLTSSKSVRQVESALLGYIKAEVLNDDMIPVIVAEANRLLAEKAAKPRPDVQALLATREELTSKINRLMALAESESDLPPEFTTRISGLKKERKAIDEQLTQVQAVVKVTDHPITEDQVRLALTDLRGLLNQDIAIAAPVLRKIIGPIKVFQKPKPHTKNRAAWWLQFKPTLADAVHQLAVDRNCPDAHTWEFLRGAIWTIWKDAELCVDGKLPRYITHCAEIVRRLNEGETQQAIAASFGATTGLIHTVWRYHHGGHAHATNAPPIPQPVPPKRKHMDKVAEIYHNTGKPFKQIAHDLGIHQVTALAAHALWHEMHPDMPGDIPHAALCGRSSKIPPVVRRQIIEMLNAGKSERETAEATGTPKSKVWQLHYAYRKYMRSRSS